LSTKHDPPGVFPGHARRDLRGGRNDDHRDIDLGGVFADSRRFIDIAVDLRLNGLK
jgi:hypothetical protein